MMKIERNKNINRSKKKKFFNNFFITLLSFQRISFFSSSSLWTRNDNILQQFTDSENGENDVSIDWRGSIKSVLDLEVSEVVWENGFIIPDQDEQEDQTEKSQSESPVLRNASENQTI